MPHHDCRGRHAPQSGCHPDGERESVALAEHAEVSKGEVDDDFAAQHEKPARLTAV